MTSFHLDIRYKYEYRRIWIDRAGNDDDKKRLNTLVREIEIVTSISEETGLYVVVSFEQASNLYAVTTLARKIELTENELCALRNQILEYERSSS